MHLYDLAKAAALGAQDRANAWADGAPLRVAALEFLLFGIKQAWACLFAGAMLTALLLTFWLYPQDAPLARYDLLFAVALAIQFGLIVLRLERPREVLVIALFHLVGTAMEVFKTAQGSWAYPEDSVLRIGDVPLFSGFMYACVGSYLARTTRLMQIRYTHHPPLWATLTLAVAAYVNFFSHHYTVDLRWILFAVSAALFWKTTVWFTPDRRPLRMPLLLAFALTAGFIWLAENVGTFAAVWVYPAQREAWSPVALAKFGSWYLLLLLSYALVALVHPPKAQDPPTA